MIAPVFMSHRHVVHLVQLAFDSEFSNIDGGCLVGVAIQVDIGVPGVEDNTKGRCGLVDNDTLYVVATSSWADSLKGGSKYWSAEGVAKELGECA